MSWTDPTDRHHCGTACLARHMTGYDFLPVGVYRPISLRMRLRGYYWRVRKVLAVLHGSLPTHMLTWPDEAPAWLRFVTRRLP